MQRLAAWLARHPAFVVSLCLALTAVAVAVCVDLKTGQLRTRIDPSTDRLLPPSNAERAVYERLRESFGDSDAVLIAVEFKQVFTVENLAAIATLTGRLVELPGVSRVFSLATAPNLTASDNAIEVSTFTQQAAKDPSRVAGFSAQLAANPVYRGSLVSDDGRVTVFALSLSGVDEEQFMDRDYPALIRAAVREVAGDRPVWITGSPVVKAATTHALLKTLGFTIPMIFLIMAVVLYAAFRSLRSTLVCLVAVGMALLWTIATVVAFDLTFNLVTAIVPPLVLTLGLTYAIHVLSDYMAQAPSGAEKVAHTAADLADAAGLKSLGRTLGGLFRPAGHERMEETLKQVAVPVAMSFATTVIGFLALAFNPLPAIQQFGFLSVAGVAFAALVSLLFIPAALSLTGSSRMRKLPAEAFLRRGSAWLAAFDLRHRVAILLVGLSLIPVGLWLATDIKSGSEYIRDFSPTSPVRTDYEAINKAFNGANSLSILIETHVNDALTDPALAREIEQLQVWLRQQPEIGSAISYVDFLKLTNQSLNDGDPAALTVPRNAAEIKQLLIFGGNEELNRFIDGRMRTAQVTARMNIDGSIAIAGLVERIEARLAELPPPLDAHVTGSAVLATHTVGDIVSGQVQSIAIAMGGIWLLLALLFTSVRSGLIAMLPTAIPVAVYFGALSVTGIGLSPTTSLIACIVLGVTVDEIFHFLTRFNTDAREKADETAATRSALDSVLRPVTLNAIALCLGFMAFAGGELRSQVEFGLLAAFTLFVAWLAGLFVTPALGSFMRIVTLWDLLRLDLGRNPQHTIPLMSGLSSREAKVFALMSRLERYRQAARIITQGDPSRDMYVIVDGELQAWVDRDGHKRVLSTMGRGSVLGETGFFGQKRTANVDSLGPARLLRFDSQDLERLRERYPRIAATVFRNLNRIQAERLARTTAMLQ